MDNKLYVNILLNTLKKKNNILDKLIEITLSQEEYIATIPLDIDKFTETLTDKESLINQLNQLDDGFDKIYVHVKEELKDNKDLYKEEVLNLQELVKQVTEKSVKLQNAELLNKTNISAYFAEKKKEIKNFNVSSQTVSNYYKNNSNQYDGQSYFLDKKK